MGYDPVPLHSFYPGVHDMSSFRPVGRKLSQGGRIKIHSLETGFTLAELLVVIAICDGPRLTDTGRG